MDLPTSILALNRLDDVGFVLGSGDDPLSTGNGLVSRIEGQVLRREVEEVGEARNCGGVFEELGNRDSQNVTVRHELGVKRWGELNGEGSCAPCVLEHVLPSYGVVHVFLEGNALRLRPFLGIVVELPGPLVDDVGLSGACVPNFDEVGPA